ncbi:MAG: MBL fold metallo-hydrolase [Candidatus Helarchaeales archaeon]
MTINKLKIIRPGLLILAPTGLIKDARSTVVLIQTEKNNIIIDTSRKADREIILMALKCHGLHPDDINILINTHDHKDHVGNNDLFEKATIYVHHKCRRPTNCTKIDSFPFKIEENIEIIDTPGHSWDSISILVKRDKNFVIAGDTIPIRNNYINWIIPFINVDRKIARESMKKIVRVADVIIPGHDFPVRVSHPRIPQKQE